MPVILDKAYLDLERGLSDEPFCMMLIPTLPTSTIACASERRTLFHIRNSAF